MTEFCIYCNKKKEDYRWKNSGSGWYCSLHYKSSSYEWIPERIKQERKTYAKDILQPRREGVPSKEFMEAYPNQVNKTFTAEEIKQAKNVWN